MNTVKPVVPNTQTTWEVQPLNGSFAILRKSSDSGDQVICTIKEEEEAWHLVSTLNKKGRA